jgi:hypothetical protein
MPPVAFRANPAVETELQTVDRQKLWMEIGGRRGVLPINQRSFGPLLTAAAGAAL